MKGTLSRREFDILASLERERRPVPLQELAALCGKPQDAVEETAAELNARAFIRDQRITPEGLEMLEPYRARRAVFLAAGFGSRLMPITLNTPKPLVRVNGVRMIDTLLDAIFASGIEDIVIVRGYLAEQFDQLLYKYPMLKFVENHAFNEANNISSAMCVRQILSNTYVLEADLLLHNPALIAKYAYCSNFLAIPVERTDDWCFQVRDGTIRSQQVGGVNCFQEVGISYWDERDGAQLAEHIRQAYEMPGGKERYWDQVPFVVFPEAYQVEVRLCGAEDVTEIDTFRELKALDKTYDV